jgi:hypothetical protein
MKSVGFTGCREGMTEPQKSKVYGLLTDLYTLGFRTVRHGICIGSDWDFHNMCKELGFTIIGHPGVNKTGERMVNKLIKCDALHTEKYFLLRNRDIVNSCEIMIATPNTKDQSLRSGTWSTIRYAKKCKRNILVVDPEGILLL